MDRRGFLSKILHKKATDDSLKESSKLEIDINKCIAWNGIVCNNCADVCHLRAIEFLGLFRPTINEKCDNCNECIASCFKEAIHIC